MPLLAGLLIALFLIAILLAIVVFSPIVVTLDSRNRQVRLRWLGVLEFLMPLPGGSGAKHFYVLRKPVRLATRQTVPEQAKAKTPATEAAPAPKPRKKRRFPTQFFMQCLGDSRIRHALARQLWKFGRRVTRSVELSRASSDVSLPDPALNGMLAGALAATPWGRRSNLQVNFSGENSLFLEFRFHPHRVFGACLFFLPGLPYRAMFRQWRTFSAARTP